MIPPSIREKFDDNTNYQQAGIIAYELIREHEEETDLKLMAGINNAQH